VSNHLESDRPTALDPALRSAVARTTLVPVWVALAVVAVPFAVGLSVPLWVQYLPLVASGVVLGLPHGAVDHLVGERTGATSRRRSAMLVTAVYATCGLGYLALWYLAPVPAAVLFVVITWIHWGQGDVYVLDAVTGGQYPRSVPHRGLSLLVRGAFPMAVPLVAGADQYRRVIGYLVGLFGADVGAVAVVFAPDVRLLVGAAVALLTLLTLARGLLTRVPGEPGRQYRVVIDRGIAVDAVETTLLWGYFLVVPPILAVGLYFCVWHSLRHVVRMLVLDDRGGAALRSLDVSAALARFARDATPLTGVSLVLLGVLALLVPRAPGGIGEGVALYLVFVAVLTLPHVVVVSWLDHVQGIWSTDRVAGPAR